MQLKTASSSPIPNSLLMQNFLTPKLGLENRHFRKTVSSSDPVQIPNTPPLVVGCVFFGQAPGATRPPQNPAGGPVRTPPFKDPHESKPWYCWKSSVCSEKKHDFTGTSQASIVHQEGGGCRPVIPSPCGGPQPPSQFLGQIWQLEA